VVVLLILSGIAEAIGIAAFLPFLQIFIEGKKVIDSTGYAPFDDFIKQYNITLDFFKIGLFIVLAIGFKAVFLSTVMFKVAGVVSDIATDFRNRYIRSILKAKWSFLAAHSLGRSLNSISTETFRASQTFVSCTRFISCIIQVLIYLVSAFILSWKVSIGIIFVGILTVSGLWVFVRISRNSGLKQTESTKEMLSKMGDIMQGIKSLRAMSLEKKFINVLLDHSRVLKKAQFDQIFSSQSLRIFHEPLMVVSAIVGIYVAMTFDVLEGAKLILIMVFFVRIMSGLNSAQSEYQNLAREESALWSLLNTISDTESNTEITGQSGIPLPSGIQELSLEHLVFAHGTKNILRDISLSFHRGSISVLMGESGSGKTTILDMICRFHSPSSGEILANGVNIDNISLEEWRKNIGFVTQEVFLFNGTIAENISMGRENIPEEAINKAIKMAGLESYVSSLPDGMYSYVGESGRMLSGGQRQRISIARAIVTHPQVLLLDEPTSALDEDTEKSLLETFKNLSRDMIVIMATHNPVVQNYTDCIYRVSAGVVTNYKEMK
jgi:ATP-binding cassette subfamily C protein